MNVLYFAPAASPQNPSMCPFVTQRVLELQRQGIKVTVLQFGNIFIKKNYETKYTGFLKTLAIVYKSVKSIILKKNKIKKFTNEFGSFEYFDNLYFPSYNAFFKWYKKNDFSLIHAHFLCFSKILPELKHLFSIPYVVTIHGSDIHEITSYDSNEIEKAMNILTKADKNIFVSEYLLNHAKAIGYNSENYVIIRNGINKSIFYVDGKKKISSKDGNIYLGFVGHPNFIKRADILPMVLKLVKKEIPNAKLIILGSETGDLLPYIKLQTCNLGLQNDIFFISSVSPELVGDYMRSFNVLLFPSRNDGFGCVAIEAQACGIGVVASANGGIPEAVGKNGICVSESENFILDYANAVIKWLKEEHNTYEIAQRVKGYTWENCVKKEIEVYKSL